MSITQSVLRRIPKPSVHLFAALSVFGALVVMGLAIIDGSATNKLHPMFEDIRRADLIGLPSLLTALLTLTSKVGTFFWQPHY